MADKRQDNLKMEDYAEFEEQLKLQEIEKVKEAEKKTRTDEDGTVYEYDEVKKAWFPKIDDFFIASYQMNYGGTPANISTQSASINELLSRKPSDINCEEYRSWYEEYCEVYHAHQAGLAANEQNVSEELERFLKNKKEEEEEDDKGVKVEKDKDKIEKNKAKKIEKAKRKIQEPAWCTVEESKNTNVYVNGLPDETTDEEFVELMSKVGLLAVDAITKQPKFKLYKGDDGVNKGDARCCYLKPESVQLALDIIDGSEYKGHRLCVERATFTMKGSFDPIKKRRKLSKTEKKKLKERQEKLLGWTAEGEESRPSHERVVVIRNVFDPLVIKKDPAQVGEIRADVEEEARRFGRVKKVTVYDRHDDGVVTVAFKSPPEADVCVKAFNGRWFDKRLLNASNWDGRSKFLVEESEEEMAERLKKWHSFLQGGVGGVGGGVGGVEDGGGSDGKKGEDGGVGVGGGGGGVGVGGVGVGGGIGGVDGVGGEDRGVGGEDGGVGGEDGGGSKGKKGEDGGGKEGGGSGKNGDGGGEDEKVGVLVENMNGEVGEIKSWKLDENTNSASNEGSDMESGEAGDDKVDGHKIENQGKTVQS